MSVSVATLLLVCLKIGLHGRWIVSVARRYVFQPAPGKQTNEGGRGTQQPLASRAAAERRDFLKLAGVLGAAAFISLSSTLDLGESQAAGSSNLLAESGASGSASAKTAESSWSNSGSSGSCSVRCPRGCSYPGHCWRYTDANGNNRCDLGECM